MPEKIFIIGEYKVELTLQGTDKRVVEVALVPLTFKERKAILPHCILGLAEIFRVLYLKVFTPRIVLGVLGKSSTVRAQQLTAEEWGEDFTKAVKNYIKTL